MSLEIKSFNFLSALTAIVVLMYIGTSIYAYSQSGISWEEFSGAVGPLAGLLLGYWVRGAQ